MSRLEFVSFARKEGANMRQLCRNYGISPTTGYKWLKRYERGREAALRDRSRRPRSSPLRTSAQVEQAVMQLHRRYPYWGPRKLRCLLSSELQAPAPSTIGKIIGRHGSAVQVDCQPQGPFQRFEREAPNQLWQMDFKGDFALSRGGRCYPFMLVDDHSRFALTLEALGSTRMQPVQEALQQAFRRYGLPEVILADNGNPWGASDPKARFTTLGVWLLRLGVDLIHGRPYHPQTQGKCERLNRTLEVELLTGNFPWQDLSHCQPHFYRWRHRYNHIRPHESLQMQTPATRYRPSPRALPEALPKEQYLSSDIIRIVKSKGEITFKNHFFYVGRAFQGLPVALRATAADPLYDLYYAWKRLGSIDLHSVHKSKFRYHPIIADDHDFDQD